MSEKDVKSCVTFLPEVTSFLWNDVITISFAGFIELNNVFACLLTCCEPLAISYIWRQIIEIFHWPFRAILKDLHKGANFNYLPQKEYRSMRLSSFIEYFKLNVKLSMMNLKQGAIKNGLSNWPLTRYSMITLIKNMICEEKSLICQKDP